MYKLYFDGASRSNPGPASYGGVIIDPNNNDLIEMEREVQIILDNGGFSVPSKLEDELKINPFLRFDVPNIKQSVQNHFNINVNDEAEIFKYIRQWKDKEYD